jgi:hypothetical protein
VRVEILNTQIWRIVMLKLYSVVLGGRAEGCNTELHDVVFAVGESIRKTFPTLVNKWFGIKKRLHLDSYIELNYADGYNIIVSKEQKIESKKLYFVNFGAYKDGYFGEVHDTGFYVGTSENEILMRAKQELCVNGIESHCDDNIAIDDVIEINLIDQYYLHFLPAERKDIKIISDYQRLDLPEILDQAALLEG